MARSTNPLRAILRPAVLGLLAASPAALGAQQGTITYTHSINIELELPPEIAAFAPEIPSAVSRPVLLYFDPAASLLIPAPQEKRERGKREEELEMAAFAEMSMAMGMMGMMKKGGGPSVPPGDVRESYVEYGDGRMVETRSFMGRTFRVVDQRPVYEWRLTSEQAEHLGYMVIKATAEHDSTSIEAWFTPQIPLQGGPGPYGGLPGMILVVSVDDGHTKYFATEIALQELEAGLIREPDEGDEVSQEEYDRMVEEKTEEMLKMTGARRWRGKPEGDR